MSAEQPCPKPGEIRTMNGRRYRFIERELEGDKWELIEVPRGETKSDVADVG